MPKLFHCGAPIASAAEMAKAGTSVDPVSGAQTQMMPSQPYNLSPDFIARTRAALAK